jgi:hypothetical protein
VANARLASALGGVAAVLLLLGAWTHGSGAALTGRVTRIELRSDVSGGRVFVGDRSVYRADAARFHLGDDVDLSDDSSGVTSTLLVGSAAVAGVLGLANALRARWMRLAITAGWTPVHARAVDVAVGGRQRTLAWLDGTLADTLGVRRVRRDLGPTARVAGDPATRRFVLDDGHHLLAMKAVARTERAP